MASAPLGLSDLQMSLRHGVIDLGLGLPDPTLLPIVAVADAMADALSRRGGDALNYGYSAGPGPLLEWLRARHGRIDGNAPAADEIMTTAGNSNGLDLLLTLFAQPGEVVLVESPSYHLGVAIIRDHPVEVVMVPVDEGGLVIAAVEQAIDAATRAGKRVAAIYTVPTFHNPTGVCLAPERRAALVTLAERRAILVIEDDVYRELSYDGEAPHSLASSAPAGVVARLGSFSKSLAPGLRLGWLTADRKLIARVVASGLLDSSGGHSQLSAVAVSSLCLSGAFDPQVERYRAAYRERRDALLAGFAKHLPAGSSWTTPAGGFFSWVTLPEGIDTGRLQPLAESHGVTYTPGARSLGIDGPSRSLRAAFCLYPPGELREGARRLGMAL